MHLRILVGVFHDVQTIDNLQVLHSCRKLATRDVSFRICNGKFYGIQPLLYLRREVTGGRFSYPSIISKLSTYRPGHGREEQVAVVPASLTRTICDKNIFAERWYVSCYSGITYRPLNNGRVTRVSILICYYQSSSDETSPANSVYSSSNFSSNNNTISAEGLCAASHDMHAHTRDHNPDGRTRRDGLAGICRRVKTSWMIPPSVGIVENGRFPVYT